tara:strand:+ start:9128 stop:9613 length:486 start_codon:yes stop_codon:yes gene_type:complete
MWAAIAGLVGAGVSAYGASKAREEGRRRRGVLGTVFGDLQSNAIGLLPEVQNNEIQRLETQGDKFDLATDQRISQYSSMENKIGQTGFSGLGTNVMDPTKAFTGLDMAYQASNQQIQDQKSMEIDSIQKTFYGAASSAAQGGAVLSTDFNQAVKNQYGGNV